ncbi:MAG TPA: MFS transporter [Chryseosolibacter sp.]|nr:MFS transporter [Chryseosolibacter sp.]
MDLKNKQRIALSAFFFLSGTCFATWTSRIPTIKSNFGFNDAELGTILLFMPISSLIGLPVSGFLVSRYESRKPLIAGFFMAVMSLLFIGLAANTFALIAALCGFAFSTRIFNIAVNTQAITLQKQFDRRINGSFHGLWSTGGIVGVAISTLMVALKVDMTIHLSIVSAVALGSIIFASRFLLRNDRATTGNKFILGKPDPYIVYLGLLVFFAAICEGGMFDWSGIYFREIVQVDIFTLGYLTFMICMALSRFASDAVVERIGMPRTYMLSSALICAGILLSVALPYFWTAMIGFCLVGLGTASVIPMTFALAGASKKYSPGLAISIIATYSIVGMLIGPPMIGYISHALNLRVSFLAFAFAGLMLIPISQLFFRHQRSLY